MASYDSDSDVYLSASSNNSFSTSDSFESIPSLCETLSEKFSDVPKNFNIIHINSQSIPAHFIDIQASLLDKNIHAILVSESWLKPCLPSALYSLPGFNLLRNDRTGSGGGGVAIYLRSHIPFTILSMSAQPPPSNAGEHLLIEVLLSHTKILLGVYYSPSLHVNYFSSFESLLETFVPLYSHVIIMGDFNTCLLKNDSRSTSLTTLTNSSNMHTLPLNSTHHFPNCAPSLLDLILVSSLQHVAKHGQCEANAFSYHDLIYLSYKVRPPKPKPKTLLQRNFSAMAIDKLLLDARNLDWASVVNAETLDNKVSIFNSLLTKLYDVHAPIKSVKIKHFPAPWLTSEIKLLMHKKSLAKSKYKIRPTDYNKEKYTSIRNRCNRVCRDALRRHIHSSIVNEDPAKIWHFLRSLGVGKSSHNNVPHNLDINSLNQHFSSSSGLDPKDKIDTLHYLSLLPTPNYPTFSLDQFAASDVKKSILSIQSNAMGSDNISRKMILPIIDIILPIITHIMNFSVSHNVFPSIWKEAYIIPLPKKSNPTTFSEYRPISILPFLSKVLERLVNNQLCSYLPNHNLLNPMQSGFRPGHSTVTALVKITDDIRTGMETGQLTILLLLDFSNAFNTIDFDILLATLSSINISPSAVDWFRSYLHGRRQRVRLDETFSSWCSTLSGVPQGGVLSPLLFALFINSISHSLSSSYHLYADDLQIYALTPLDRLADTINDVNEDVCRIVRWSKSFGLQVNPIKTQAIIIGSSRMTTRIDFTTLPNIVIDGTVVPYSSQVKNLGVILDNCLSWVPQLESISRKIYASGASLRRLRNFLPTATKVTLAQSLLLPIIDYADACFPDLTEEQLNKLERLQNFCIRFIFGLRKYDHVSEFRTKLKWLPIRLRRNLHILSLLYNILFNPLTPHYLKERFKFLYIPTNTLVLRSSENLLLRMPAHGSRFYDRSFTVTATRLWNVLPPNIRRAQSLHSFRTLLYNHYLSSVQNYK